jgi:hypothetical protein
VRKRSSLARSACSGRAAVGDVARVDEELAGARRQPARERLEHAPPPVPVPDAPARPGDVVGALGVDAELVVQAAAVVGVQHVVGPAPDHLVGPVAEQPLGRRAHVPQRQVGAGDHEQVAPVLDELPEAFVAVRRHAGRGAPAARPPP